MKASGCFSGLAFILLLFGKSLAAMQTIPIPLNERTLVIYNSNVPESLEVANYYLTKRGIPAANKCAITPTKTDSIDWYNYEINVRNPIRSCLNNVGKDKILYIVFAYQSPYKIMNVPAGATLDIRSLDQFVADIWNDNIPDLTAITSHPYFAEIQSQGNFYPPFLSLADYRNQSGAAQLYSVWRLDAATKDLAQGLIDKAMQAEATGLQGQACFDRRLGAIQNLEDWSFGSGDWDLFRAADFAKKAGMNVLEDDQPSEFGTAPAPLRCENAALYAGWYSYNNYNDAFSWANGAIGFHLDSASAVDPRDGANWSANAVKKGITVTSGAVNEPYLDGLPHPDGVFRNLFEGANVGDAFLRNTAFLQWMIINIGDPLYRPFPNGRAPFDPNSVAENSLRLSSSFVVGGNSGAATMNISVPAPAGGTEIKLTTSRSEFVSIPDSVRIPEGAKSVGFSISTKEASSYQPAMITATFNTESVVNTLTVAPLLSAITFTPASVPADTLKTGTIYLNDFAPSGGVTITLSSNLPEIVRIPATVFIPAGEFKATFTVKSGVVAADAIATISASLQGAMQSAELIVTPINRRIVSDRGINR